MSTPHRLTPKILDLVATDRVDRPPVGRLTTAQTEVLAEVARKPQAFAERVSAPRAIHALARGAGVEVSIPVLDEIVSDPAAAASSRVVAARELGLIATPEVERALVRRTGVSDPRVQQAVFAGLGSFGGSEALRQLASLQEPDDPAARRQLALARALIAHRLGLDGPFLPAAGGKARRPEELEQRAAVTLQLKAEQATATDRERLVGSTYGIALAERAAALKCGRMEWTVFFNHELDPATLGRLFERPWIAALMGRWYLKDKALTAQHLVLSRPEGSVALIDVVRTDGERMYTGRAEADGTDVRFSLADVDRPGTAPTNVIGRMSSRGIELEGVVASIKRTGVRSPEPVVMH
jgi:hypothetical protein